MLERYFCRPVTCDRIRARWLGPAIEQYVTWLTERGTAARHILRYVSTLVQFSEFAQARGATTWEELPDHVAPWVRRQMRRRGAWCRTGSDRRSVLSQARTPVEQMLRLIVPGFVGTTRHLVVPPFSSAAPGFWDYLETERGLKPTTLHGYIHHLRCFERYLQRAGVTDLSQLRPAIFRPFIERRARTLRPQGVQQAGGAIRVLLRYLHRQRILATDLSGAVDRRREYRQATIPRSITWEQVRTVLAGIDRRDVQGKRDYAMLLLLVTYGLRANEVAVNARRSRLKRDLLRVRHRKGGHATMTYPLSPQVGTALVEYLQDGRAKTADRHVFLNVLAPFAPVTMSNVSQRSTLYLQRARIGVPRPGSHTFRHACVQRLVDADFSFKTIGDYVGHRRPATTQIYGKVAVETLRQVALGDGEEVLQ